MNGLMSVFVFIRTRKNTIEAKMMRKERNRVKESPTIQRRSNENGEGKYAATGSNIHPNLANHKLISIKSNKSRAVLNDDSGVVVFVYR